MFKKSLLFVLLTALVLTPALAERVKDLATVSGVRSNQLVGYGLVVGLNGTGDKNPFTDQSLRSMLTQLGVNVPPGTNLQSKNVAAVSLHADLPPFAKPGQKIDVTASSVGNSKSLRGGTLLMSPLKGADGKVYAIAQGNLIVGGLTAGGADGSSLTVNIPSVGRVPGGATVERTVPNNFAQTNFIELNLKQADFTTATRLAKTINDALGAETALAADSASVRVRAPAKPDQKVSFMAFLESLEVEPGEAPAKVIVNTRTGTVVINRSVKVLPAAVTHGSLTVTITETNAVSQPGALSNGETAVVPQSDIEVDKGPKKMFLFNAGVELSDIVKAVNQVGAAPSDLVAILEALKEAGSLRADLVVI